MKHGSRRPPELRGITLSVGLGAILVASGLSGCAARVSGPARTPEQHAANIAAAQRAGYKVITTGDRTTFCPTASPTGSHMAPTCMTERQFESLLGAPRSTSTAAHVTNQSPGPGAGAGH
jgi:hypothetical protein